MIYAIGDSHTWVFTKNIDDCVRHHVGPVTMNRLGRDGINIRNYGVGENDFVVFVFGEIDVRCHLGIQRDRYNRDEEEIIDTLTEKYMLSVLETKQEFMNSNFALCSVVPPTNADFNPAFPIYGKLEDRIALTKKLNRSLKNKCDLNDIGFLDIYDYYALDNGELNPSISDGKIHIHPDYNNEAKECLLNWIYNMRLKSGKSKKQDDIFLINRRKKVRFNDMVTIHYSCSLENGNLVESSMDSVPFRFTVGKHEAIVGLQRNVTGMYIGESKKFTVLPDKAYGNYYNELVREIDRKELPVDVRPEIGQHLRIGSEDGDVLFRVSNVSKERITLDANHPLAGKPLFFEVHLIDIA